MHLTPAILEAAYNFLRTTPPFKNWKLPESDVVEFRVTNSKAYSGMYDLYTEIRDAPHRISISQNSCAHTDQLIITMAHEMTHIREFASGQRKSESPHGRAFKGLAAQVCKQHGIAESTF